MRRLILATAAVAMAGFAVPAYATTPIPVGVHEYPNGSVCVGVSEQVPVCTPPFSVQLPKVPTN